MLNDDEEEDDAIVDNIDLGDMQEALSEVKVAEATDSKPDILIEETKSVSDGKPAVKAGKGLIQTS